MLDHGEAIVRHAEHAAHQFRGAREPRRHDADRGNAKPFGCY
jgi:hypothetical protein